MKITEDEIKKIASNAVYRRGIEYAKEGRVHIRMRDEKKIVSMIDGEEVYNIGINFDDNGHIIESFCTCPYYTTMHCTCKHIVATLKVRQKELESGEGSYSENDVLARRLCNEYAEDMKVHLNAKFALEVNVFPNGNQYNVSMSMGERVLHNIEKLDDFLTAYAGDGEYKLSKFREYSSKKYEFSKTESKILDILSECRQNKKAQIMTHQSVISFGGITAKRLIPLLLETNSTITVNGIRYEDIPIHFENPEIPIDIIAENDMIAVSVTDIGVALVPDGSWFLYCGEVYKTDSEWQKKYMPIYYALIEDKRTRIDFLGENGVAFASGVLPKISDLAGVVMQGVDEMVVNEEPVFELYFDRRDSAINCVPIVKYGDISLKLPSENVKAEKMVVRNYEQESVVLSHFSRFNVTDGGFLLDDSDEIFHFFKETLPKLEKTATIIKSESFEKLVTPQMPKVLAKVRYNKDIDLLQFDFETELSTEEIKDILSAIKYKKPYYKTKTGEYVEINENAEMFELIQQFGFDTDDIKKRTKSISKYYALYLDGLANKGIIVGDEGFKNLIKGIRSIKADIPKDIDAVLRNYQRKAVDWMMQLKELSFGGILADDMGLGKTLEVIAFVMSLKKKNPALVIAPSALLYNWKSEIERFAKTAKTLIIDGNKTERNEKLKEIGDYDFVITSYPILRRDLDGYSKLKFSCCVIDEAQYIKNPQTQNAKGVKRINADIKFALTGTPVENSVLELWSIFDFVLPGYLGDRAKFISEYEKPIEQGFDKQRTRLKNRIKPFVMRRMKADVLAELPEKIEDTIYAELVPEQKKMYEAYLSIAKNQVGKILTEHQSGVMILSILMRLRQICCHPSLFDENYKKDSGKLELLTELVSSAILSGHRVLVFSQFTSMLKIIESTLKSLEIKTFYLDGKTSPQQRQELSDRFNGGEGDVFLISLKAGGTGMNLTGADMVIHYDPWWNPAVTDQASDRAYRIGQTKAVQVIRLATKGTIEERILKLQDKKRALADDIITKNSASLSNLTNEEIMSLFEL